MRLKTSIPTCLFSAVLGISAVLGAQSGAKNEAIAPPTLRVCDVLARPLLYDGELIRLRGEVVGTDEGAWFKGEGCPGVLVTDGYVWDPLISIEAPGDPAQIHSANFEYDLAAFQRLTPKYQRLRRLLPDRCIVWTYTGVFETRKEWAKMINGKPRGFGHLNAAPGALIARSADDVAAVPGCSEAKGK